MTSSVVTGTERRPNVDARLTVDVDVEVFAIALLLMLSSEVLVSAVWK